MLVQDYAFIALPIFLLLHIGFCFGIAAASGKIVDSFASGINYSELPWGWPIGIGVSSLILQLIGFLGVVVAILWYTRPFRNF